MRVAVCPVLCVLVLFVLIPASCAAGEQRSVQWTAPQKATLHWGDSFSRDAYTLVCTNLPRLNETGKLGERFVGLDLYVNGVLAERLVLTEGDEYVYSDELRITVLEIHATEKTFESEVYDPYAVLNTEVRGYPAISLAISTDKRSYTIPEEPAPEEKKRIVLTFSLKNTGAADLYDCEMNVDTGGLVLLSGDAHPYVGHVAVGEKVSYTLVLELPYPKTIEESLITRTFMVNVSARGEALKGEPCRARASHTIEVLPMWTVGDVRFTKTCYPSWVRVNDTVGVKLYIENDGIYPLNVHITDTPPPQLEMLEPTPLSWNVSLAPGKSAEFSYTMRLVYGLWMTHPPETSTSAPPSQPPVGVPPEYFQRIKASQKTPQLSTKTSLKLPPAKASIVLAGTEYSLTSNSPAISVYLPNVSVKKTVSTTSPRVGENVSVSVSTRVVWDMRAKVDVRDSLPEGAVLVSGNLTDHAIMRKGESRTLSYVIRFDRAGRYTLPPAHVSFENLQSYASTVFSAPINITVRSPEPHMKPPTEHVHTTPPPTPKHGSLSGFGAAMCACALLIIVACRRLK